VVPQDGIRHGSGGIAQDHGVGISRKTVPSVRRGSRDGGPGPGLAKRRAISAQHQDSACGDGRTRSQFPVHRPVVQGPIGKILSRLPFDLHPFRNPGSRIRLDFGEDRTGRRGEGQVQEEEQRGHGRTKYHWSVVSAKWLLVAGSPLWADSWTSLPLPGENDLSPASVPTWEDSVLADRSTARCAVRATSSSSRKSMSIKGSPTDDLFVEYQSSDPGGTRRRVVSWRVGDFSARVGDLDTWTEDPLVEGNPSSFGSAALSDASGWLEGSGLYPNGIDVRTLDGPLSLRGRWRSDRLDGSRREGAGSVHIGAGAFQASLRSEDGSAGSDRVGSAGFDLSRFHFRGASNDRGDPAFWAGVDSSDGIWHLRGSSRWISHGFRHGGIPKAWPGTAATDLSLAAKFSPGFGGTWRTQALLDSAHGADLRTSIKTRARPVPGVQLRAEGLVDHRRNGTWASSRLGVGTTRGAVRPWIEQSWSDSTGSPDLTTSLGLRWFPRGHALRAEILWNWRDGPSLLLSHEGSIPTGGWDLGFRIEGGTDLPSANALRGQGVLTCAW